ncbi:UDP-N-acetylmuramoyl-L-alanyl-D-glutamate--2,6-diaminopimelate ligase [Streptomonospora nanhaiensis]|uniref:UDP-N-acetylmuramoyl-L-alanyl-D-glutamate--2,6-diaminopimelate ligase n=1 Tax=Streptomonospora nanhaiensis TaxID=1323731 RepID=A0A853BHA0_9ACTN|nr:UDP-N-acetylmuramoyl-L-alanyl-D-glutamate--2,6-diaminopimelate ligase [Streptomonospora nanhaiensis]MBV2362491.1 UDP-N-acetylmuramoyl-L-alanyl-D-glutamate--2,6-diaminopimelate ligase [Streptomonospora nanhaiensis]MBX9390725.1 UDP-N-acetylmuramoyl-L-alanyl-D-glutamate--2,6-diaminopimelate ligase [Streptomonospora nanhaiensis]NYI94848.1 UDP-N-acetylmuramoyl-L-alanyl-D-glutamate--2,6-diaminopimelate ligase [Streptomonospora nanhaiensis]
MRPEHTQPRPLSELARLLGPDAFITCVENAETGPEPGGAAQAGPDSADPAAVRISGITHDSRAVRPGDLYAALPGSRAHGADFAAQAAAAGAVAILTDPTGYDRAAATRLPVVTIADPRARLGEVASWVYGAPAADLLLIGTTGTSGKTTVTYLVESGLRAAGLRTGLVGTVEIRVGDDRVAASLTTPEATDLHGLFAQMREQGATAAAMEVSSHALALGRVGGARYNAAVFTNLSQDHLDFHSDLRDYFDTKARLFTPEFCEIAVVNSDDRFGRVLIDQVRARGDVPVTTFSAEGDPDADWRAVDVRLGAEGSTFRIAGPGGMEADASVALPGAFNVSNAIAAIVGLVEAGIPLHTAIEGVAAAPGVPGRMERVEAGQDFTAVVDYSHKPGAIEAVLTALRGITEGELTIVVGCGGDRDRAKRPLMGEAAARLADAVILTDDNPRTEDPVTIVTAMLDGVAKVPQDQRARVTVEPDRAAAIELAVARARPGDVVVVAGKGHETGQYVAGSVLPFDDRDVLRAALARRLAD